MNQRLLDAMDLLKMLEVVFEQRQSMETASFDDRNKGARNHFPWSGVRLTLKQSRDLLSELLDESEFGTPSSPRLQTPKRSAPPVENRPPAAPEPRKVEKTNQISRRVVFGTDLLERLPDSSSQNLVATTPRESRVSVARENRDNRESRENTERSYKGTFNRIQLTQEPMSQSDVDLP